MIMNDKLETNGPENARKRQFYTQSCLLRCRCEQQARADLRTTLRVTRIADSGLGTLTASRGHLVRDLRRAASTQKLLERVLRIDFQGVAEFSELDEVHAALAAFDFRHERLRIAQPSGQFDLRQPDLAPKVAEQLQ